MMSIASPLLFTRSAIVRRPKWVDKSLTLDDEPRDHRAEGVPPIDPQDKEGDFLASFMEEENVLIDPR